MGAQHDEGTGTVTNGGNPPKDDEFELTLLGPGYGESIALHTGDGVWVIVDSCGREDAPAALDYLENIGVDPCRAVAMIVATHWHDDHIRGLARMLHECSNASFCCAGVLCNEEFLARAHALECSTPWCGFRFQGASPWLGQRRRTAYMERVAGSCPGRGADSMAKR